jgi:hypothetical protein
MKAAITNDEKTADRALKPSADVSKISWERSSSGLSTANGSSPTTDRTKAAPAAP